MLSQALVLAACALGAVAQSTTTMASASAVNTATATLLVGSATTGLAASVIAADSCDTTYNLVCTDTAACSGIAATVRAHHTSRQNIARQLIPPTVHRNRRPHRLSILVRDANRRRHRFRHRILLSEFLRRLARPCCMQRRHFPLGRRDLHLHLDDHYDFGDGGRLSIRPISNHCWWRQTGIGYRIVYGFR